MPKITIEEYYERSARNDGICLSCHEFSSGGVEPDAEGYECELCGQNTVLGIELAMILNDIEVVE